MPEFIELIVTAKLTLPAFEICLLLIALAFCLVAEHPRVGLTVAYLCVFRWGWQLVATYNHRAFLIAYGVFGAVILFLALVDYVRRQRT